VLLPWGVPELEEQAIRPASVNNGNSEKNLAVVMVILMLLEVQRATAANTWPAEGFVNGTSERHRVVGMILLNFRDAKILDV
jgi:hypothetical protein